MSRTVRRLACVVVLLAGTLVAVPAQAADQLSGPAYFDPAPTAECPLPAAPYDDYDVLVLEGSLQGCWYTDVQAVRTTPSGVYLESGEELFVGRLDGGEPGSFTTVYKFEAKYAPSGAELKGRCQHPLVAGSGTGGFAGATGRVDFKDIIGDPVTYVYRGHIRVR